MSETSSYSQLSMGSIQCSRLTNKVTNANEDVACIRHILSISQISRKSTLVAGDWEIGWAVRGCRMRLWSFYPSV
jgi:hypothetical protein